MLRIFTSSTIVRSYAKTLHPKLRLSFFGCFVGGRWQRESGTEKGHPAHKDSALLGGQRHNEADDLGPSDGS